MAIRTRHDQLIVCYGFYVHKWPESVDLFPFWIFYSLCYRQYPIREANLRVALRERSRGRAYRLTQYRQQRYLSLTNTGGRARVWLCYHPLLFRLVLGYSPLVYQRQRLWRLPGLPNRLWQVCAKMMQTAEASHDQTNSESINQDVSSAITLKPGVNCTRTAPLTEFSPYKWSITNDKPFPASFFLFKCEDMRESSVSHIYKVETKSWSRRRWACEVLIK